MAQNDQSVDILLFRRFHNYRCDSLQDGGEMVLVCHVDAAAQLDSGCGEKPEPGIYWLLAAMVSLGSRSNNRSGAWSPGTLQKVLPEKAGLVTAPVARRAEDRSEQELEQYRLNSSLERNRERTSAFLAQ